MAPMASAPTPDSDAAAAEPPADAGMRVLIGRRLRELREERGLSLRDAAERSGLSRSFIGTVEKGDSEIAVSRLIRLADAYGVLIADLLATVERPAAQVEHVPASNVRRFPTGSPDVEIEYLASPSWPLQPFRVRLEPGGRLESLTHPGAEFIHCVAGWPTLVVNGREYRLKVGDTIVIPDHAEHAYLNETRRRAELLGAVARPQDG
jgi:transcriptional regulator with XRE-family HTH domain